MTGIGRGSGHVHCWAATECRERAGRRAFMAGVVLCVALGVLAAGAVTPATALPLRGPAERFIRRAQGTVHKATSHVLATPLATKPHWACPTSACEAIIDPHPLKSSSHFLLPDGKELEGSGEEGGLDPADIRSAYKISLQTVAPARRSRSTTQVAIRRPNLIWPSTARDTTCRLVRKKTVVSKRSTARAKKRTTPRRIPTGSPRTRWTSTWHRQRVPNAT